MVRTRADGAGSKAVGAKAPRKNFGASSSGASSSASSSPSSNKNKYSGGNPVCQRPVPEWQKGIQLFFPNKENKSPNEESESGGSSAQSGSSSSSCSGASGAISSECLTPTDAGEGKTL